MYNSNLGCLEAAQVWLLFGGQFGSEGKGKAAAWLSYYLEPEIAVCAFSANAGHISYSPDGEKYVAHTLPQAAVYPGTERLYIGPGAAIHIDRFFNEVEELGRGADVFIDYRALVIQPEQQRKEAVLKRISSTCQGVGQAYADRTLRNEKVVMARDVDLLRPFLVDVKSQLKEAWAAGKRIQIEGCQGWELDVLHGFSYPYCTSRSTGAAAIANDCGFPLRRVDYVMAVCRTYPIRVGNVIENNTVVGYSGPIHKDSTEYTWGEITRKSGSPVPLLERTTVTKKVRRIFSWSARSFEQMAWQNNIDGIWLNFVDYLDHSKLYGCSGSVETALDDSSALWSFLVDKDLLRWVVALGTGPEHNHVLIEERRANRFLAELRRSNKFSGKSYTVKNEGDRL